MLFIKNIAGKDLSLCITLDSPVSYLKQRLEELTGIPVGMKSSLADGIIINCIVL